MKLFYGEKLVSQNEYLANNKNLIYRGKKLLLLSDAEYKEISMSNKNKLVFWGEIYAVLRDNGKSIPIDMTEGGESIIKKIFNKSNLDDIIKHIEGDFVGCLIKKGEDAVVFSDNFNRKDVFYSLTKNGALASTDLSSVVLEGKKTYDQAALANLLSIYGMHSPKKHTIYKEIHRLGVGERLVFKNNNALIEKIPFSPVKTEDYGTCKLEEYMNLLEDAVKIRGSGKCNWIYLSGGYDSTALLALLVKNFGSSRVKAITAKLEYSERSKEGNLFEIERAKKFADYYSVDIEIVPIDYSKKDSVKHWEKIRPYLRDNHIYSDNSCLLYLVSEHLRKKASPEDALFSGEVSDGAHNLGFAQFTTILEHPVLDFREYSDKMASYLFGPTFFKSILDGTYSEDAVYKLLRSRLEGREFDDSQRLDEYERKIKFIASFFLRNNRIPFYSLKNLSSLTEEGAKMYESEMCDTYLKECVDNLEPNLLYSWILRLYNSFHWQGSTIKSFSVTAQYNNFNLSMPYWDIRLQQFLSKMPENWGRGLELRPTKYPLKWMLERKIDYPKHLQVGPHSYIYDVDSAFSFSTELLYYSALRPDFQKTLKDYPFEKILDKKYFNLDYYRKLTDDYINGVEVKGDKLNDLLHLVLLCWIGWY